jgi:putative addiction module killer protein
MEIVEYLSVDGRSPFGAWFEDLSAQPAARVTMAISRMQGGNFSQAKAVGAGVFECKIDFGPGYRVYFGRDGERLIILLAGGTKKRQQADIVSAQAHWAEYKKRKKGR